MQELVLFYNGEGLVRHSIFERLSNSDIKTSIDTINEHFRKLGIHFDVMNLERSEFGNGLVPQMDTSHLIPDSLKE